MLDIEKYLIECSCKPIRLDKMNLQTLKRIAPLNCIKFGVIAIVLESNILTIYDISPNEQITVIDLMPSLVILGVLVGTLVSEYLKKSLNESFPVLGHLHPTASFQLLHLCLNTRLVSVRCHRIN